MRCMRCHSKAYSPQTNKHQRTKVGAVKELAAVHVQPQRRAVGRSIELVYKVFPFMPT